MVDITTAICITMGACIVSYFWGKKMITEIIIGEVIDTLRDGGYIKTKLDKNGDEEIIKIND